MNFRIIHVKLHVTFFFFFEMALILDEFGENVIFFKTSFMSFIKTLAFSI